MTTATKRWRRFLPSTLTVIAFLALWEVLGRTEALGHHVLPPFFETLAALGGAVVTVQFWSDVQNTLLQWVLGLLGAAVIAIPLGLFLGGGRLRQRTTRSTIDFLRTIPPVMLLPLFVLIWGTGLGMVVLLSIYAAVWPMLTQTISGMRQIDQMTLDTMTSFKIGRMRRLLRVLLPAVSPFITSGVRISAVISLFVAIVCELVAGSPGLGQSLAQAQLGGNTALMCALILVTGALGIAINFGFQAGENRLLAWHPAYTKEA